MMMNCEKIQALIPDYANACLTDQLQTLVENHIQHCTGCQLELEGELEMLVNLGSLPLVKCPQAVTNSIWKEIEIEERNRNTAGRYWWTGATTLVAAGLALILLMPTTNSGTSDTEYSQIQIQTATKEAQWALARVATVINRNESHAFEQVFGQEIPGAVEESLRLITKNLQGEV